MQPIHAAHTRAARAHTLPAGVGRSPRAQTASVGGARARRPTCKNALAFSYNTTNTMCAISTDYDFVIKPSQTPSFTTAWSLATRAHASVATMALDGHTSQPGPALAPLTGRPPSTTLAPTLAFFTGATELTGVVTTARGHARQWRNHAGHPKPPRGELASAIASRSYHGCGCGDG